MNVTAGVRGVAGAVVLWVEPPLGSPASHTEMLVRVPATSRFQSSFLLRHCRFQPPVRGDSDGVLGFCRASLAMTFGECTSRWKISPLSPECHCSAFQIILF